MELLTSEHMKQFIALNNKNEHELQAICDSLSLETVGTKQELIFRLMDQGIVTQKDINVPQFVALRTTNKMRQPIQEAREACLQWRKFIFQSGKLSKFHLTSPKGEDYWVSMKYIRLKTDTLQRILNNEWYVEQPNNRDLITSVKSAPENFLSAIVLKKQSEVSNWLMLYLQAKGNTNDSLSS
jgi:hypothetical protein